MTHDRPIAVTGGTALIGREQTPVPEGVVVTTGTEIVAAGPREEVEIPSGAQLVDAAGGTVIPGFIDAHVHIGFADPADVVRRGVTTARDLAWPVERIFPLVERSRDPGFEGPTLVAVGPMLTVDGGYPMTASWAPPGTAAPVSSPDHAETIVADLDGRRACAIKVALNPPAGRVLDADTLQAITSAAHERGLGVTAHIHGLDELDKAIDAGIDELAHMLMSPERLPDDTIARLVGGGVAIVPTLSVFPGRDAEVAIENLARFVGAGGTVVYGTDLGNAGPEPGIDVLEVTRMEAAGMTPVDIVRSATVEAARWLGLDGFGVLEPGARADIVCVAGPLDSATALTQVQHVIRAGRMVR